LNLSCAECRGITIVASATAFPLDLGKECGDEWQNPEFLEVLFEGRANHELAARGWTIDEPFARLGVHSRQWLRGERAHVGDLAVAAATRALDRSGTDLGEIDLLLTATSTPSRITSSLASYVAGALKLSVAAFDIRAGGAAGLFAWLTAIQFLRSDARTALIVAAETPSRFRNRHDPLTTSVLGDGAGAVVLRRSYDPLYAGGLVGGFIETLAVAGKPWTVPGLLPPTIQQTQAGSYEFQVSDSEYNSSLRFLRVQTILDLQTALPEIANRAAYFVSNAPTRSQAEAERNALRNPTTQLVTTLTAHGFLGCAGPFVAFHELRAGGSLLPMDLVLFSGVGGGVHRSWLCWQA
jgi:3-oxoacyl-[acyl-carrier-protein] synthase-3